MKDLENHVADSDVTQAAGRSSTATHTPGPWTRSEFIAREPRLYIYGQQEPGFRPRIATVEFGIGFDEGQLKANAHLIAAAPDLLQSLQKIINNWGNLHPKDRTQARRAIRKADGRS